MNQWSPTAKATPEVQQAADKVKDVLEKKVGKKFEMYQAKQYRKSPYSKEGEPLPVGAVFYLIRMQLGSQNCCNIKVEVIIDEASTTKLLFYQMEVPCDSPLYPIYIHYGGIITP